LDTSSKHLILELWDCKSEFLDNENYVEKAMFNAAHLISTTVLNKYTRKFSPQGVTTVIVIAESHLSIHTFPEHNYAAIDVFTCGKVDPSNLISYFKEVFQTREVIYHNFMRGVRDEPGQGNQIWQREKTEVSRSQEC
jgi:S-adenosylmethionine decarboxylase